MKCSGHLWQHGLPCAVPGCDRGVDSFDLRVATRCGEPPAYARAEELVRDPIVHIEHYERFRVNERGDWIWVRRQ